jgi:hypothetical protein
MPLRKGRLLLKSGFFENIQNNFSSAGEIYFVREHVHHSMKSGKPLLVFIAISNASGYIKYTSCNCKASEISRCCHVTALLLYLSDYVTEHGFIVKNVCTSEPCQWNKGKKRTKNPTALHQTIYSTNKRWKPDKMYNWDPRPLEYQNVNCESVTHFVTDLQLISSQNSQNQSMWETLLQIKYDDFHLSNEDTIYYRELVQNFEESLLLNNEKFLGKNIIFGEIPDTVDQAKSLTWHQARWCRITASVSKKCVNFGESLNSCSKISLFTFLEKRFWFSENNITMDMKYGIEEEPKAVINYSLITNKVVVNSGIWINQKYPHLGATPDGLIYDDDKQLCGIIEIKCLKIFKSQSVNDIIKLSNDEKLKAIISRQCFSIVDQKLILKKSHMYYFQIQHQLLVTQCSYCDFVMHSGVGDPHIERILPNEDLHRRIIQSTKLFWSNVLVPEYFIMKVPRKLMPEILN